MDYLKIKELSSAICDYQTAIDHIQSMATKLVSDKTEMNVSIKLTEVKPFSETNNGKNNVYGSPVELQQITHDIFRMHLPANYQAQEKPKFVGLEQDNMPNEVALIILNQVNRWYVQRKKECEAELYNLLNCKIEINDLGFMLDVSKKE